MCEQLIKDCRKTEADQRNFCSSSKPVTSHLSSPNNVSFHPELAYGPLMTNSPLTRRIFVSRIIAIGRSSVNENPFILNEVSPSLRVHLKPEYIETVKYSDSTAFCSLNFTFRSRQIEDCLKRRFIQLQKAAKNIIVNMKIKYETLRARALALQWPFFPWLFSPLYPFSI